MPDDFKEKVLKWETALREKIAKKPERRAEFATVSELPIDRVCWPWSAEGLDPANDLGIPGSYPFTAVCSQICIEVACGPCVSMQDSVALKRRTRGSSTLSSRGRPGCPWHLICPHRSVRLGRGTSRRRSRQSRRSHRQCRGFEAAFQRHRSFHGQHLDDNKRAGCGFIGNVHRGS